jgi:RHS repeat-associated protein
VIPRCSQARHYAPALGRFLQPDPVAAEANAWAYAENSPGVTRQIRKILSNN